MSELLQRVGVASPCPESWEDMEGDETVRHCERCEHSVYDLSGLSKAEAEALLEKALGGERVCGRLRRRADGRVLTADCPSQLREGRSRGVLLKVVAALLGLVGASFASGCQEDPQPVVGLICPEPPPSVAPVDTKTAGRRLPLTNPRASQI